MNVGTLKVEHCGSRQPAPAHQVVCCECHVGPLRQDDRVAGAERKRGNRDRKNGLLVAAILDLHPGLPVGKPQGVGAEARRLARFGLPVCTVNDDGGVEGTSMIPVVES